MKKIFSIVAIIASIAFASLSIQSCDVKGPAILYSVTVSGDADGNVVVDFPDGNFNVNGTADLNFMYSNDSTAVYENAVLLENALETNSIDLKAFALEIDKQFNAAAASGSYYISVDGYAKQPDSGLTVEIHKVFSNRDNE